MNPSSAGAKDSPSISAFRSFELMQLEGKHLVTGRPETATGCPSKRLARKSKKQAALRTSLGSSDHAHNSGVSPAQAYPLSQSDTHRGSDIPKLIEPSNDPLTGSFGISSPQPIRSQSNGTLRGNGKLISAMDASSVLPSSLPYEARPKELHHRSKSFPPAVICLPPTAQQMRDFIHKSGHHYYHDREHNLVPYYGDPVLDNAPKMPRADQLKLNRLASACSSASITQAETSNPAPPSFVTRNITHKSSLQISNPGPPSIVSPNTTGNSSLHTSNNPVALFEWPNDINITKQANAERNLRCLELALDTHRFQREPSVELNNDLVHRTLEVHSCTTKNVMPARVEGSAPVMTVVNCSAPQAEIPTSCTNKDIDKRTDCEEHGGLPELSNHPSAKIIVEENMVALEQEYHRQAATELKIERFFIKRATCDFTLLTTIKTVFKRGVPSATDIQGMMDAISYLESGLRKNPTYVPNDPWFRRIAWIRNSVTGTHGKQVRALKSLHRLLSGEGIMFRENENSEIYKEAELNNVEVLQHRDNTS